MTHPQIALWASAAQAFDQRYQLVGPDHQDLPTPCGEFAVRALIDHAVGTQVSFAHYLGGTTSEDAAWEQARAGMAEALEDPTNIEGTYDHPAFGEIAREQLLAIATNDLLIHSWDLARSIGVDETLPTESLQPAIDGINGFPPQARQALFAAPVEVGDGADLQTQMLAVAGRNSA